MRLKLILVIACKINQEVEVEKGICRIEPVDRSFTFFIKSEQGLMTKGLIDSYTQFAMERLKELYSAKNLRMTSISETSLYLAGFEFVKEQGFSYSFTSYDQEM